MDDIVFRRKTIEPLAGVSVEPAVQFTDDELSNLAGIIGLDRLRGVDSVTLSEWDAQSVGAPKLCVQLGLSPFAMNTSGTQLQLGFKNPTVVAAGIDPVARTVTGRVVPAAGTRIVQPPMPYMFGIKHYLDFGTPYAHAEDYGGSIYQNHDGWRLDISDYAASNGVFRIAYDPKFADDGSAFFSLSIKDFRY